LDLVDAAGAPVSLLGWSLGGVIAREVARREPDAVRRVITYGTPVVGGAPFTAVARANSFGDSDAADVLTLPDGSQASPRGTFDPSARGGAGQCWW